MAEMKCTLLEKHRVTQGPGMAEMKCTLLEKRRVT